MPRLRNAILMLTATLVLAGCAQPAAQRVSTFISPLLASERPERVVVVPFDAPTCFSEAGPIVTQAVALAVQEAMRNDVVTASARDERLTAEGALWQRGRVDVATLIAAQKTYMADAFLFGAVTHYKPYEPPLLGVKLRMLSARTGDVIWAAEGLFDTRDNDVHSQVIEYFKQSGLHEKLHGANMIFMSPRQYSLFVAVEMLRPLKEHIAAAVAAQAHAQAQREGE